MDNKFVVIFLIGIIVLSGCAENKTVKQQAKVYVIGENLKTFEIEQKTEAPAKWLEQKKERLNMLRSFRNDFSQKKEDFEFEKKSQYQNVRASIDDELIVGYVEAPDLDKNFEQSLVEPDVKSDSIYATQSGRGGGFRENVFINH